LNVKQYHKKQQSIPLFVTGLLYLGLCKSTPSSSESMMTTDWSLALGVVAVVSFVWLRVERADDQSAMGG
jgi:hypothetical protein